MAICEVMMTEERNKSDGFGKLILLGLLAVAHFHWRVLDRLPPDWRIAVSAIFAVLAVVLTVNAIAYLLTGALDAYKHLRALWPRSSHGSARWATRADASAAGLHRDRGIFIGVHENEVIRFENETHTLVLAPAGAGKTICAVIPQLALLDTSMLVTDLKGELIIQTARYRERHFGHRIVSLNPPAGHGFGEDAYNVCQIVLDDLAGNPQDALADATAISFQLLKDPAREDQNVYFRQGGRKIIVIVILGLAVKSPKECTLVTAQRIATDVPLFIAFLEDLRGEEALSGDIAAMAESLLACHAHTPREFQAFLNGAAQALAPFAPSGRLAKMSDRCTFRFAEMKQRGMTIYAGCDMTRMKVFAPVVALWNWAAMVELQRCGNSKPVLFLLDEAANFAIEGLPNSLTALRGYGIRVFMVFQELEDIARVYGREALATVLSQTQAKLLFGIISQDTALKIEKLLGSGTIEAPNFNMGQGAGTSVSESRGHVARPLMTADEIRRLPSDQQIVLIGNLPPLLCRKVGYHEMEPMRSRLAANPFHGNRRLKGEIKVRF